MSKNNLFYVEIKNARGEYEPLGIMTLADAIRHSWERDHAAIQYTPLHGMSPAEAR